MDLTVFGYVKKLQLQANMFPTYPSIDFDDSVETITLHDITLAFSENISPHHSFLNID